MKKIITAAAIATFIAGAAFADISFSYTGRNYFQSAGNDNLAYDNDSREDCMSFGISNDVAGAVVDFDISKGKLTLDEYYGYMNFGSLQAKAGVYTTRNVNRVNTDAGDLDGEDFELYKPGVLPVGSYNVASDSDNLTGGELAMTAEYGFENGLSVKGGLVKSSWDSYTEASNAATKDGLYSRTNSSGFIAEVGYGQEDLFNATLAFRTLHVDRYSFGLFVSPTMVENLDATIGFSLGIDNWSKSKRADSEYTSDESGTEFGFDLRARYQLTEKLSVTTMNNISSYLIDDEKDSKKFDTTLAMWNMINVTYAFADNLTAGCTVQNTVADFDENSTTLIVSPSLAIKATEKATVTLAARGTFENVDTLLPTQESFTFKVPVIFSYNY